MEHETLRAAFLQGGEHEASGLFNEMLRGIVRGALLDAMAEEVTALCGPRHHPPEDAACRRAGSEVGSVYLAGRKEEVRRPRVRDGEGEVVLDLYAAASRQSNLYDEVIASLVAGGTSRGVSKAVHGAIGKSAVSKMWKEKGQERIEHLRSRDLSQTKWLALMIDGVWVSDEACVVVALGIGADGSKCALDFERGTSESATCVGALLERLAARGFDPPEESGLLVCRDGSAAIAKAVKRRWPWAIQQECLVHCERNVSDKLKRADRPEARRHFARLRKVEGRDAGEEAFAELVAFLAPRNAAAKEALEAREETLLALHRLEVPSTLHKTFLSTNCIENIMRNWRGATRDVKRWREDKDMIDRWSAFGLLLAEEGFRKVSGYADLPALAAALAKPSSSGASSGSGLRPSPPSPPEDDGDPLLPNNHD